MMDIGVKILMVSDPKLMEVVLASTTMLTKSPEYKLFNLWFGDGLLTSTGYKWRTHRKILTPGFHFNILQDFVKVFEKTSEKLAQKLQVELGKTSFDVYDYIYMHTLDIICQTAMGASLDSKDDRDSNFIQNIDDICDIIYHKVFSVTNRLEWIYKFKDMYRREKQIVSVLREYSNSIIQKRRKTLRDCIEKNQGRIDEFGIKGKHTFLDILLLSNIDDRPLSDEEIREEVDTFIFEGHDTTAVAICFALYSLAENQNVQRKAYDEIKSIVDSKSGSYYEDLQELKYLELVIKETLRLYPSVPAFGRTVTENTQYYGGILPKGLTIGLLPFVMHRDPKLYPEPEKFYPERFSMANQATRHPFAYVPFSAGPRNCIGQKFAMLELKSTLSTILMHFELLPAVPKYEPILFPKITTQSANGIKFQLKKRAR